MYHTDLVGENVCFAGAVCAAWRVLSALYAARARTASVTDMEIHPHLLVIIVFVFDESVKTPTLVLRARDRRSPRGIDHRTLCL